MLIFNYMKNEEIPDCFVVMRVSEYLHGLSYALAGRFEAARLRASSFEEEV